MLRSGRVNYWTGNECREFEREFADYVGTRHAVAVANGTVALELALQALDIPPGSEVIVPSRTFLATASAVVRQGCRPVFADVDPISGNLCAATIEPLISKRTRAVICVHLAGWPCEMDGIRALADQHQLRVIEDCAQAHGAAFKGRPIGSLGDAAAFSFCQDKIMTTGGEGGMLTTSDEHTWKRAWSFKDHGKGWDSVHQSATPGAFRWLHDSLGTNWRMTELQAVLGRVQLQRLADWVAVRRRNANILTSIFNAHHAITVHSPGDDVRHSYYKFYASLSPESLRKGWSRDRIVQQLLERGIPSGSGSCCEIYRERAIQEAQLAPAKLCTTARRLGETSLMFPVHPTLSEVDMHTIGLAAVAVIDEATSGPATQQSNRVDLTSRRNRKSA